MHQIETVKTGIERTTHIFYTVSLLTQKLHSVLSQIIENSLNTM